MRPGFGGIAITRSGEVGAIANQGMSDRLACSSAVQQPITLTTAVVASHVTLPTIELHSNPVFLIIFDLSQLLYTSLLLSILWYAT